MSMLAGDEVLSVRQVSVVLSGQRVLHEVDLTLRAGEFCGLIGANGSGKTTLLRTVLGLVAPGAGSVEIGGAGSVGYVPQTPTLDPMVPMRTRDLVGLGLDGHRLGLPMPFRARRRRIDDMLLAVGASDFAEQRVGTLSGGQLQRALIAHALIRRPRLLLLDEPLANLDVGSVTGIVALLRRLADDGVAVLLSAHDMNPLLPAMDRIVYLARGRAVSGRTEAVVRTEVLSALYGTHIDVIKVHGRILVVASDVDDRATACAALHVEQVP